MSSGIPYDSDAAASSLARSPAILDRRQLRNVGAEMAKELGAFPGYKKNREHMLRVIRNHRRAACGERSGYEKVCDPADVPLDHQGLPAAESHRARQGGVGPRARARQRARLPQRASLGDRPDRHHRPGHGLRHHRHPSPTLRSSSQEAPPAAATSNHQLAAVPEARSRVAWLQRRRKLPKSRFTRCCPRRPLRPSARHQPITTLQGQGLHRRGDRHRREGVATAFDIKFVFNKWTLGEEFCVNALGLEPEEINDPKLDLLARPSGFTKREIDAANVHVCGAPLTIEGARPHLR